MSIWQKKTLLSSATLLDERKQAASIPHIIGRNLKFGPGPPSYQACDSWVAAMMALIVRMPVRLQAVLVSHRKSAAHRRPEQWRPG